MDSEGTTKSGGRWILHPFFFIAAPVVHLYWVNNSQMPFFDIVPSLAILLAATLVLLVLGTLLFKKGRKFALVLSTAILLNFLFRDIQSVLQKGLGTSQIRVVLSVSLVLFLVVTYLVIRSRREFRQLTTLFNCLSLGILAIQVFMVVSVWSQVSERNIDFPNKVGTDEIHVVSDTLGRAHSDLPDIYYLIFDRYASEQSLKDYYDFDNSDVLQFLRNKGFYVASESKANYLKTALSLASSLNLSHIPTGVGSQAGASRWLPLYEALDNHLLGLLLKSKGYTYVHVGSSFAPTSTSRNADVTVDSGWSSEFSMALYRSTAAYPVLGVLFGLDGTSEKYACALRTFENIAKLPKSRKGGKPLFVFGHFLLPHDPYVFHRDGSYVTSAEARTRNQNERVAYVDQLIFTNEKIKELVAALLADSEKPPIIILQSDEGPFPPRSKLPSEHDRIRFKWLEATPDELRQKMGILNAFYLPGVDTSDLYPSISPVNSFRVVFNLYFGSSLELLPDRSYASPDQIRLYEFHDITDRLK